MKRQELMQAEKPMRSPPQLLTSSDIVVRASVSLFNRLRVGETIGLEHRTGRSVTIEQVALSRLSDYAGVPMSYEVNSVIEVIQQDGGIGGLTFSTKSLASPYVKNYDAYDKGPLN